MFIFESNPFISKKKTGFGTCNSVYFKICHILLQVGPPDIMEGLIEFVQQVCPNRTNNEISDVFEMIREQNPCINSEELVDTAVAMLLQSNSFEPPPDEDDDEEGASGFSSNDNFNKLISIFPDAKEEFVWTYCQQQGGSFDLSQAIDTFAYGNTDQPAR